MINLSKIVMLAFVFSLFTTANAQGPLNSLEILEEQRENIERINQQRQEQIREVQPPSEQGERGGRDIFRLGDEGEGQDPSSTSTRGRTNQMRGAFDQDNQEVTNRMPERTKNRLQEKKQEIEEKINQRLERVGERRKRLDQDTQEKVTGLVMSIFNRFSQVNKKFDNAVNRIEERAQFFSENFGIDLDRTNSSIENLRNSIEALDTEIIASGRLTMERVDSEIAPEEAREIVGELKISVKNVQQEIKDLIQILREEILEKTELDNATSSQN